jgi:FKBP-type peptidyl-prolyl cis-trans isomerase FkpA
MTHPKLGIVAAVFCIFALNACAADAQTPPPKTDDEKSFYAIGQLLSEQLTTFQMTPAELKQLQQGLADGVLAKKPALDAKALMPKIQELQKARFEAYTKKNAADGLAYVTKAATEKGATKTASGIVYTELKAGTGASPTATDEVKVHYTGTLIDGKKFDSSVDRGEPATFPLNGVIPCWTEGVQLMKVGGKAKLVCPSNLAYGERGQQPSILPDSTLVFEVELLEIVKAPPPAPEVAPAPAAPTKK